MYFDWYYVVLVIPTLIAATVISFWVNSLFDKYSRVMAHCGMTGRDAALCVLAYAGIRNVPIDSVQGKLTDHYDPSSNKISLSATVYSSPSVASIAVAAHEAGHACQYATGYAFAKLRSAIVPVTNFTSNIGVLLIPVGIVLCYLGMDCAWIAYLGVILYSSCFVFQLITLPVEFDASRRAMKALQATGTLSGEELTQARKMLTAAALTYVAALATTAITILRFILLIGDSDRRRR